MRNPDNADVPRPPQAGPLRRPLNPFERGTKFRIFVLVAMLMLVLAIAERARDPKSWRWLQSLDQPAGEKIVNRLPPQERPTAGDAVDTIIVSSGVPAISSAPPAGSPTTATQTTADSYADSIAPPTINPAERAWAQGWKQIYEGLEADQKSLLYRMLLAPTDLAGLGTNDCSAGEPLLAVLERNWSDYAALAFQSIATLEGDDKARWIEVIDRVNRRWRDELKPALEAILVPRVLTAAEKTFVSEYLHLLDTQQLASIRDDSPFRPSENQIFFRLFKTLQQTSAGEIKAQSSGELTYLQLFKQPDAYRGKLVTIRGTVKLAYRVKAFENLQGIESHCVFWIFPGEGVTSPIVVYSLEVPPGFPPLQAKHEAAPLGKPVRRWDQDVEITGYFFKRWAYPGKDGTYTAPLIFAKNLEVLTENSANATKTDRWLGMHNPWNGVGIAFTLATIASIAIFFLAFRSRQASSANRHEPVLPEHWESLTPFGPPPTTAENLRRLRDGKLDAPPDGL